MDVRPLFLANAPTFTSQELSVLDKYRGTEFGRVALADEATLLRAIEAAVHAQPAMARLEPYERKSILEHCVRRIRERQGELADTLCAEAGKPIRDARGEVSRLIDTFTIAAEESVRLGGETLPLAISARARGTRGFTQWVPVGPCSLIAPFNFPLNLAAHKMAPAIAAGCTFVLKPASRTPISSLILAEILAETALPRGAFSVLPMGREGADLFTTDPRFKLLSFTGSPAVGWDLKARAGQKKVVLELGGNAACIVDAGADLGTAIPRLVFGAFYQAGQSCISVQRILVHRSLWQDFVPRFVEAARALRVGDPRDEETFLGPLIDGHEAERLEAWIASAVHAGAKLLLGGRREGAMLDATVLTDVPRDQPIVAAEAFGPVVVLSSFSDFSDAIAEVNDSRYGLQAGVFTPSLDHAMQAWNELEVGGVVIGDVPSFRVDSMPYGGVKDSGLGREGIRHAMREMSEERLLVLRS